MKNINLLPFIISAPFLVSIAHANNLKKKEKSPNIIYILADDLGYGDIGCYGQQKIETPNIDKLAEQGMLFTDFYSNSPVSAPSRCSLLTGLHTGHSDIRGNDCMGDRGDVFNFFEMEKHPDMEGSRPLQKDSYTFAQLLQENGYATAAFGKWGLGTPFEALPAQHGFDLFYGYICQRQAHTYYPLHLYRNNKREMLDNDTVFNYTHLAKDADPLDLKSYEHSISRVYSPDLMHKEAINFINKNKEKPFFVYYCTPIPHAPLQAPQKLINYYVDKFGDEKPYLTTDGYYPQRYPHATYAAMITYLDQKVGDIINCLKHNGIYDNTILVFTSDNGPTFNGGVDAPWFNSGGLFKSELGWGKCYLHEGGIRVPMIVRWKDKIKANSKSNHVCIASDIFSTVADLTKLKNNHKTDGISFAPTLLAKQGQKKHKHLYWEFLDGKGQQAVRFDKWKGIRFNVKRGDTHIFLYDLNKDIKELHDVANQHPDIIKKMREIMQKEHKTAFYSHFRTSTLDTDLAPKTSIKGN